MPPGALCGFLAPRGTPCGLAWPPRVSWGFLEASAELLDAEWGSRGPLGPS